MHAERGQVAVAAAREAATATRDATGFCMRGQECKAKRMQKMQKWRDILDD